MFKGHGKPCWQHSPHRATLLGAMLVLTSVALGTSHQAQAAKDTVSQTQDQLEQIEQQLEAGQHQQTQLNQQYQALQQQLKQQDLRIGQLSAQLHSARQQLTNLETTQRKLQREQTEQQRAFATHQQLLAQQLTAAYRQGQAGALQILLGDQEPGQTERLLGYWQALSQAQRDNIQQLKQQQVELAETERLLTTNHLKQQQLVNEREQTYNRLQLEQRQQHQLLAQLSQSRQSNQQQLAALAASQSALNRHLSDAIEAQAASEASRRLQPLEGLNKLKSKLTWPVKGKLSQRFGSRRLDQGEWSGVLIQAKSGSQVRSIHHGEVIFADWLRGYGLVIVIDHGDDYLSLYAHNQSLLHNVGDRIQAGEPIALVGNSGGENTTGLYFEIRHQGQAVDPALWCRHG